MPASFLRALGAAVILFFVGSAWGFEAFTVDDIEVQGLQRLETGTVLNYLPLSAGDRLTRERMQQAIQALYDTGLFEDVRLAREDRTLLVQVEERPEIASFDIEGNERIGGDELKNSLKQQGLAEGELFKRALLDQLELELRRQYYANGFYGVSIDTRVESMPQNRVDIQIQIDEGRVATIRDINIVGNQAFEDERLREILQLQESRPFYTQPLSFWRNRDRYSKEKLLGDLESLNSFYQDRGYLRFSVTSIQVSLSPDRRDIFLTINVEEGSQYKVSEVNLAGDLIVPEANLRRLVSVREGEVFSRREVTSSTDRISTGLSDFGYAFAEVDPLTKLDDEANTVDLTLFVEPGKRAYVRRITFSGNDKTNDETLRREMRQFEGGTFSRRSVERSRTRLSRLQFVEDASVETEPVPGSDDLVDVDFEVSERPAGTLQFGVGFSDAQGFLINGSVTHSNFRGTGNRVSVRAETNDFARSLSGSWTDPYFTDEGVSRTVSAFFRDAEQIIRFGSSFDLNSAGASTTFRFPLSEFSNLRLGAGVENNDITSALGFEGCTRRDPNTGICVQRGFIRTSSRELFDFIEDNGRDALTYELRTGLQRDTRNRSFFATRGSNTQLNFDFKVPGSDLEYFTTSLEHERYFRIGEWVGLLSDKFVLESDGRVAWSDIYGSGTDVPPYDHFFAGGARSVRGFEDGSLGPRDSFGNPFGGEFLATLQNELVVPTPLESDNKSTRLTLFYDVGNVFRQSENFDFSDLRSSAGVAFYWFTPFFGLLRVSYAAHVDAQPGDEIDRFQFSFGVGL